MKYYKSSGLRDNSTYKCTISKEKSNKYMQKGEKHLEQQNVLRSKIFKRLAKTKYFVYKIKFEGHNYVKQSNCPIMKIGRRKDLITNTHETSVVVCCVLVGDFVLKQ